MAQKCALMEPERVPKLKNSPENADTLSSAVLSVREGLCNVKQGFRHYAQFYAHCFQGFGTKFESLRKYDMCSTLFKILHEVLVA